MTHNTEQRTASLIHVNDHNNFDQSDLDNIMEPPVVTGLLMEGPAFMPNEIEMEVPKRGKDVYGKHKPGNNNIKDLHFRRALSDSPETRSVVVLRVSANDAEVTLTLDEVRNDVFYDDANVMTQMDACSYGWTKIEPFNGETETGYMVNDGVVDIAIDTTVSGEGPNTIRRAALDQSDIQLGSRDQFDHIMVVLVRLIQISYESVHHLKK